MVISSAFIYPPKEKVSSLGVYKGYNTKDYKGYSYQSQYVMMPDEIRLATDVFLPKKRATDEKFPTIIYFDTEKDLLKYLEWLKEPEPKYSQSLIVNL